MVLPVIKLPDVDKVYHCIIFANLSTHCFVPYLGWITKQTIFPTLHMPSRHIAAWSFYQR